MRVIRRAALTVLAVWLLGFGLLSVQPAYAAVKEAVQNVFITNTADNPVPVVPQGTTPISGTVTVANPTPAASQPIPIQQAFETQPITRQDPFVNGTLYQVPAGKVLTVEHFQAHWLFSGVRLRQAVLTSAPTCNYLEANNPNINRLQLFFADQNAGLGYHVVGGPVKLHVPPGGCLTYQVGAHYEDINDGATLYVYGGFAGVLTDAPAA